VETPIMCKMTSQSVWISQLNKNISGLTTNVRWSPSKIRTSCLMIIAITCPNLQLQCYQNH